MNNYSNYSIISMTLLIPPIDTEETYPGDGKADNFQYSPYKDIKKDRHFSILEHQSESSAPDELFCAIFASSARMIQDFKDFSVPFIFSEFGCNLGVFKTKCPYPGQISFIRSQHF